MLTFTIQYLTPKTVEAFLALDKTVYKKEYQVGKTATLRRLEKNSETDITVLHQEKMVGYISLCPVPAPVITKIIQNSASEEEIESNVVPYKKPGHYDAYLSSIVVDKKNYPHFSGKELFVLLGKHIAKIRKRGIFIRRMFAVAVSIAGRKTLKRMRFKEIKANVFVYDCLKQGIHFVKRNTAFPSVSSLLLLCNKENHWGSV